MGVNIDLRNAVDKLDREMRSCKKENKKLSKRLEEAESERDLLRAAAIRDGSYRAPSLAAPMAVADLEELPESLVDVLELAAAAFPGVLVVTDRAVKSASEYDGSTKLPEAWRALRALALHGPALLFGDMTEGAFRSVTGIEAALHESTATMDNKTMRKLREVVYDGKKYTVEPHIKCNGKSKPLRIHFAADRKHGKIVIGWCGEHLKTIKSVRRSFNM